MENEKNKVLQKATQLLLETIDIKIRKIINSLNLYRHISGEVISVEEDNSSAVILIGEQEKNKINAYNKTGETLSIGDIVWVEYFGTLSNGCIRLRNGKCKREGVKINNTYIVKETGITTITNYTYSEEINNIISKIPVSSNVVASFLFPISGINFTNTMVADKYSYCVTKYDFRSIGGRKATLKLTGTESNGDILVYTITYITADKRTYEDTYKVKNDEELVLCPYASHITFSTVQPPADNACIYGGVDLVKISSGTKTIVKKIESDIRGVGLNDYILSNCNFGYFTNKLHTITQTITTTSSIKE